MICILGFVNIWRKNYKVLAIGKITYFANGWEYDISTSQDDSIIQEIICQIWKQKNRKNLRI